VSNMRILDKVMAVAAAAALMLVCGFTPDPAQAPSADIIVTSAPVYNPVAALRGEERFPRARNCSCSMRASLNLW